MRVLVVDDDESIRRFLLRQLRIWGHEAICVGTCEEALIRASAESFDLALIDGMIGENHGWDLVPSLKEALPGIRIIGMSGSVEPEEFFKAGAQGFVKKPFDVMALRENIDRR